MGIRGSISTKLSLQKDSMIYNVLLTGIILGQAHELHNVRRKLAIDQASLDEIYPLVGYTGPGPKVETKGSVCPRKRS
jgi:hypothetical protein